MRRSPSDPRRGGLGDCVMGRARGAVRRSPARRPDGSGMQVMESTETPAVVELDWRPAGGPIGWREEPELQALRATVIPPGRPHRRAAYPWPEAAEGRTGREYEEERAIVMGHSRARRRRLGLPKDGTHGVASGTPLSR